MSAGLRLRHDRLLREQAVEMFERGFSYRLTAKRLGVSAETVRGWQKTYRVIGKDGLLAMGVKHARYDYEAKELRELREQNARLKQLLGQAELEKAALRELAEGNF